jgi:uncharacterized membrane protein HdeD (DUF308 family)
VAEVVTAMHLGRHSSPAALLALVGVVSIAFGVFLLVWPGAGLLALVWALGLYAIMVGCVGIARAWALLPVQSS